MRGTERNRVVPSEVLEGPSDIDIRQGEMVIKLSGNSDGPSETVVAEQGMAFEPVLIEIQGSSRLMFELRMALN